MRQVNAATIKLITSFEGCKLQSYYDQVGVLTIGFGHTGDDVSDGQSITQADAEALLASDLERFESGVTALCTTELTDNQFGSLVSFAYNLGLGNLHNSTLLSKLNDGDDINEVAAEFLKWDLAGHVHSAGLQRRRQAEQALFLTDYTLSS